MLFKYWGDECVVYHPASGNTHLLNATYAHILELVSNGSSREELVQLLQADEIVDSTEHGEKLVSSALAAFDQLKLI